MALILLLGPAGNLHRRPRPAVDDPDDATTTTRRAKSTTTVQVANGTTVTNAATTFSHTLGALGWDVLTAVDTTPAPTAATSATVTYVYFHPG